jgi:hypothetical protein
MRYRVELDSGHRQWQDRQLWQCSAMHRVVVPVAPHAPLFELALPCEVFGLDRSDIVKDWYGFGLCPIGPGPTPLPLGLTLSAGAR